MHESLLWLKGTELRASVRKSVEYGVSKSLLKLKNNLPVIKKWGLADVEGSVEAKQILNRLNS